MIILLRLRGSEVPTDILVLGYSKALMQKQTIIKEATTPALAGREKVYVHFHIEQRVLYQSIFC
jgi:hypothetical protein